MPPVPRGGVRSSINPAPAQNQTPQDRASISFQFGGQTRFAQFGTPQQRQQYGWGDPGQLSGGQDLVRDFQQQFQPGSALFAPNFPLVPVDPELARLLDFPVGYNLQYFPRTYEPVTFHELRALAYNENLTRMCVETRKDQIEKLTWQIKPIDEKNSPKDAASRIKNLEKFWMRPDGQRPFASWLRESIEDVLVIDAPTFEILRNRDGTVRAYDIIDGSTIKVLIDITGRRPKAPAPAFQQIIHGRPWRLFTEDELIYAPRNKRPGHLYGFSPVEQILLYINVALRRQQMQLHFFTDGNIPFGMMGIPELNAEQIARFQEWLDSVLAGNLAERTKMPVFPYGAKYTAIKPPPLKDDFDEWLARVVTFCFSLPPDAFIRQRARATAETARQSALEEGLAPLMGWVKRLIDSEIQLRMGHVDLEFSWQDIKEVDPDTQSKVETMYAKLGIKSPDEVRDVMGLDPLPNGIGSKPFVVAGNQVLLVSDIEAASAQAVAPPPPGTQNGRGPGGAARAPGDQRQGARTPGAATTAARRPNGADTSAEKSAWPQYGVDDARREAHERETRQLLRRQRAARVEAALRAVGA